MKLLPLLLKEDIYGENATVFHRTSVEDLANKVYDTGFKPGDGDMYGKGFYSTYTIDSQLRSEMHKYGDIIVKFSCPTINFFFCDWEEFKKKELAKKLKATKDDFIIKQLDYYKIKYDKNDVNDIEYKISRYSSDIALDLIKLPSFKSKIAGLIFNGRRDGLVLVSYDLNRIIPLSYTEDEGKTWIKVDKKLDYIKKAFKSKINNTFETNKNLIKLFLDDNGVYNYTINSDGTVDVDDDVDLSNKNLSKIPVKFGKVAGFFDVADNNLVSLEGSPNEVSDSFYCSNNQITSLRGGPKKVINDFNCSYNLLRSLKWSPEYVGGSLDCSDNMITNLIGSPKYVGDEFFAAKNKLISLNGSPEYIRSNFIAYDNNLNTLKGAPKKVKGIFDVRENPNLTSLEYLPDVGRSILTDIEDDI